MNVLQLTGLVLIWHEYLVAPMIRCDFEHFRVFGSIPTGQLLCSFTEAIRVASPFDQNSQKFWFFCCLKIFYLKIFHLKILHWIRRQCVDCRNRNVDSDSRLFKKSTVTVTCRLSTFVWPRKIEVQCFYFGESQPYSAAFIQALSMSTFMQYLNRMVNLICTMRCVFFYSRFWQTEFQCKI